MSSEEQGLAVGVTPYLSSEKSMQTFDADLKEIGILPLQLVVRNNRQQRVTIRQSDFMFSLSGQRDYAPVPATSVAERLENYVGVLGWTMAFGLAGLFASSTLQEEANNSRRADFRNKEFQDADLDSQGSARGFLFFPIPNDTRQTKEARLLIKALDVSTGETINMSLPLGDLEAWYNRTEPRHR